MIQIVTERWSNDNGATRIRARMIGAGRKRVSVPYDHALTRDKNHERALAALLDKLDLIDAWAIDDVADHDARGIVWTLVQVNTIPFSLVFSHE